MFDVDGSMMEGGGQLLRMAITYGAVMGNSVKVRNVRARRKPPGLRPQHLTALKAVAEICDAETRGFNIGSRKVEFHPGTPRGGRYTFDIGTAGSISLLLQCVAPVAAFADSPMMLRVVGGTAVRWSPPICTMENVVWNALRQMGFRGGLTVLREGFYPKGGGVVEASITPVQELDPLLVEKPGRVTRVKGISVCGRLPRHVAERQAQSAKAVIGEAGLNAEVESLVASRNLKPMSPGSYICLWSEAEPKRFMGSDALGERGKPAERVGAEAAQSLTDQLRTSAGIDFHTADNLVLWCSLADGESRFTASKLTMHTATAIKLAETITGAEFKVKGELGSKASISCRGTSRENGNL